MALVLTASMNVVGVYSTSGDYAAHQPVNAAFPVSFLTGTGLNQGNVFAAASAALAAAGVASFDLNAAVDDAFGVQIALVKLKGLVVYNQSVTAGENLILAGNFCSVRLGLVDHAIGPSSFASFVNPTGFTVTNSSADVISITNNNAGSVTYDILFWGNSA